MLPCQHCTCVHFRRALKSQAKRCFHISHYIGCTDQHTAHSPRGDGREEVPNCAVYEKNDTFSPYVALDDVSTFEAARQDALAPLADRQDNFDSGVCVER